MGASKLLIVLVACAVFCAGGFGCLSLLHSIESDRRANERAEKPPDSVLVRMSAFVEMKDFVRSRLKAPATADFPSWSGDPPGIVKYEGDGVYLVSGFVDAQNVFGAMLRQNYIGRVKHERDNKWTLLDLRFEDP